jgi:hypothetical protein
MIHHGDTEARSTSTEQVIGAGSKCIANLALVLWNLPMKSASVILHLRGVRFEPSATP